MLTRTQAGLFSAVTSAFILDIQSQLQPDSGDEAAALLRVLIYKIDNTTFGNDTPALPQWSGPPRMIVQVQAILYASLAASLLAAFLAMLGKQWLNRYESTDMRGTAIERSQNRQRKLDGIVAWYFDPVMESLPLMLQAALLLLSCALSRYLWGIDITVASVVLGVTASGIILCIFIVVAGAASESCPYQTPGSHALRYLQPKVQSASRSAASVIASAIQRASRGSLTLGTIRNAWSNCPWSSGDDVGSFFFDMVIGIPLSLVVDVCLLGRAMIQPLAIRIYQLGSMIVGSVVGFVRRAYNRLHGISSTPEQGLDNQATALDLRCIFWMIQTSLDKAVHLSSLRYLATIVALAGFNLTLVLDCFSIFVGCVGVEDRKVVIIQGLEQLATVSATCFLRTLNHLLDTDPASSVLADVRRRYRRVFPLDVDFTGLPFRHTVARIHVFVSARDAVGAVQVAHREAREIPPWIIRFTLHSLSLNPPPPTPVIADYLSIIAIDLDCDVSNTGATTLDERCVLISRTATNLTLNQHASGASFEPDNSETQNYG